jgi:hypothetical protein
MLRSRECRLLMNDETVTPSRDAAPVWFAPTEFLASYRRTHEGPWAHEADSEVAANTTHVAPIRVEPLHV